MKRVLVVCAHPDDEILGVGGTLLRHVHNGDEVYIQILTDGHKSRNTDDFAHRHAEFHSCMKMLGAKANWIARFEDQKLDQYPLLDLVQEVERVIDEVQPSIIYTHSEFDLNQDHRVVSQAVVTAARPLPGSCIEAVLKFETASATEWSFNQFGYVKPCYFTDISEVMEAKLALMTNYESELRTDEHPRSLINLKELASVNGRTIGCRYAEAFHVHFYKALNKPNTRDL